MSSVNMGHSFTDQMRTGDVLISENVDFAGLLLSDAVLSGLKKSRFEKPSPIQLKAIPMGRCGLDLIVQAKSGTGKTCVFTVVALESLELESSAVQVLVLAPTREIAVQIWEVFGNIGCDLPGLKCHTFIGGLPVYEDKEKLKKCHIAVGTPGRIKQLIELKHLKVENIRLFILDEADKLLEESFQQTINWIYSSLPDNKQILALSATYPEYLAQHLTAYMRNPTFLRLNITDPALLGIRQYYRCVPFCPLPHKVFKDKLHAVVELLSSIDFQQCLIFSNLQTRAQNIADALNAQGWPTACIAGSLDQKLRNEAMAQLKTYKCRVLISTDLSARGIDAEKVDMVVNLDVPKDHETYLHRIGRAGRFGAFGAAVSVVCEGQEEASLKTVELKCNTCIKPLPDPIPVDLAKQKSAVQLSQMITSEQIMTDCSPLAVQEIPIKNGDKSSFNKSQEKTEIASDILSQQGMLSLPEQTCPRSEVVNQLSDVISVDKISCCVPQKETLVVEKTGGVVRESLKNFDRSLDDRDTSFDANNRDVTTEPVKPDQDIFDDRDTSLETDNSDVTTEPVKPVQDFFQAGKKELDKKLDDKQSDSDLSQHETLKDSSGLSAAVAKEDQQHKNCKESDSPPYVDQGLELQTGTQDDEVKIRNAPRSRRSKVKKKESLKQKHINLKSDISLKERLQINVGAVSPVDNRNRNISEMAETLFGQRESRPLAQFSLPSFEDVIGYRPCDDGHTYSSAVEDYSGYLKRASQSTAQSPISTNWPVSTKPDSPELKELIQSVSHILNNIRFNSHPGQSIAKVDDDINPRQKFTQTNRKTVQNEFVESSDDKDILKKTDEFRNLELEPTSSDPDDSTLVTDDKRLGSGSRKLLKQMGRVSPEMKGISEKTETSFLSSLPHVEMTNEMQGKSAMGPDRQSKMSTRNKQMTNLKEVTDNIGISSSLSKLENCMLKPDLVENKEKGNLQQSKCDSKNSTKYSTTNRGIQETHKALPSFSTQNESDTKVAAAYQSNAEHATYSSVTHNDMESSSSALSSDATYTSDSDSSECQSEDDNTHPAPVTDSPYWFCDNKFDNEHEVDNCQFYYPPEHSPYPFSHTFNMSNFANFPGYAGWYSPMFPPYPHYPLHVSPTYMYGFPPCGWPLQGPVHPNCYGGDPYAELMQNIYHTQSEYLKMMTKRLPYSV